MESADQHRPGAEPGLVEPTLRGGAALWTLFVGFALLMIGNGLLLAVLGIRIGDEGFGQRASGYVMASYFAGFLIGPIAVTRLLAAVGHVRVFASLASVASCAVLVHVVWISPVSWAAMRCLFGFCMAGLYVVIESWLNDASTPANRGRTLAMYMTVSMGGLAIGQLLVGMANPDGDTLFAVASILVSISFVPIALAATTDAPPVRVASRVSFRELRRVASISVIGTLLTGASHGILFGLGAIYATQSGFETHKVAVFIAAPSIGALLFQWPIGWVSDHVSRRLVILAVATASTVTCATLAYLPANTAAAVPLMVLLGGLTFPLYSLLLSHALDQAAPGTAIGASSTLMRVNGTGAVLGPIIATTVIAAVGQDGLFWSLVVTHGSIAVYVISRLLSGDRTDDRLQGPFVPIPARATDLAIQLTSQPLQRSRALLSARSRTRGVPTKANHDVDAMEAHSQAPAHTRASGSESTGGIEQPLS